MPGAAKAHVSLYQLHLQCKIKPIHLNCAGRETLIPEISANQIKTISNGKGKSQYGQDYSYPYNHVDLYQYLFSSLIFENVGIIKQPLMSIICASTEEVNYSYVDLIVDGKCEHILEIHEIIKAETTSH